MRRRATSCCARIVLSSCAAALLASCAVARAAEVPEEFVGPFPSWRDLRRDYGAVGDGEADDTKALQRGH